METNKKAWELLTSGAHLNTLSHDQIAPPQLLNMVDKASNILDIGCFCGGTGRHLKKKFPSAKVTGVELLKEAASKAAEDYEYVHADVFETFSPPNDEKYDCVIAADVLEHMYNPWEALKRIKGMLSSDGALYISIPNASNLRILNGLARGQWAYVGAGLLDVTHIRFFTKQTLLEAFQDTGWKVESFLHKLDGALLRHLGISDIDSCTELKIGKMSFSGLSKKELLDLVTFHYFVKLV